MHSDNCTRHCERVILKMRPVARACRCCAIARLDKNEQPRGELSPERPRAHPQQCLLRRRHLDATPSGGLPPGVVA